VPVIVGHLPPEAQAIVEARARELAAPHLVPPPVEAVQWDAVKRLQRFTWRGVPYALNLPGVHQTSNAAIALEVLRTLSTQGWELRGDAVRRVLQTIAWPARFEHLQVDPPIVLDGGHNRDGVSVALRTWMDCYGAPPGRIVFGCMKDKQADAMMDALGQTGAELHLVSPASPRSMAPEALAQMLTGRTSTVHASVAAACASIMTQPHPAGTLVLGSLMLAGEWKACMEQRPHQLHLN
jgi:dihydrofolate synthase / folylpolyglutamate synthase